MTIDPRQLTVAAMETHAQVDAPDLGKSELCQLMQVGFVAVAGEADLDQGSEMGLTAADRVSHRKIRVAQSVRNATCHVWVSRLMPSVMWRHDKVAPEMFLI